MGLFNVVVDVVSWVRVTELGNEAGWVQVGENVA